MDHQVQHVFIWDYCSETLRNPVGHFGYCQAILTAMRNHWMEESIYLLPTSTVSAAHVVPISSSCSIYGSLNWVSIGLDNGLSPVWRQAITWTNVHLLSIGPLGTNCSEILIKIQNISFTKMHLKITSAKWRPFCPGRDETRFHRIRNHCGDQVHVPHI